MIDETTTVLGPAPLQGQSALWKTWSPTLIFAITLSIWVFFFHHQGNSTLGYNHTSSLFFWLEGCYQFSVDDSFGRIVPLIVLGLFFWKRVDLIASITGPWWGGLAVLLLGLLLHIAGFMIQQTRFSVLGFIVGLYGIAGMAYGPRLMQMITFPMLMLLFCIPLNAMAETVTFPMRILVTKLSVGTAHYGLGVDVYRNGSQIMSVKGEIMYDVAPACSGIRSLVTLIALSMVYGFTSFSTLWKRLVLVAMAFPLAIIGNWVRVTTVIVVGDVFGRDYGLMIENKFGFITFAVALGGLLGIGALLGEGPRNPKPSNSKTEASTPTPIPL